MLIPFSMSSISICVYERENSNREGIDEIIMCYQASRTCQSLAFWLYFHSSFIRNDRLVLYTIFRIWPPIHQLRTVPHKKHSRLCVLLFLCKRKWVWRSSFCHINELSHSRDSCLLLNVSRNGINESKLRTGCLIAADYWYPSGVSLELTFLIKTKGNGLDNLVWEL